MDSADVMNGWTIPDLLHKWSAETPERGFLQFEDGEPWSYAEVLTRVQRFAGGLRSLGVQPEDRVLLMMGNHLDIVISWFGLSYAGGVEVPINTANRGDFLVHTINQCRASVIVIDEEYLPQLMAIQPLLSHLRHVVVRGAATLPSGPGFEFHDFEAVARRDPLVEPAPATYRDLAAVMYTSGTSGPAKGVLVPNGHMFMFGAQLIRRLDIGPQDTFMICLPLFHGNAQFVQLLAVLLSGGKAAVYPRFSGSRWISQIRACGATVTSLLGVMAQFIHDQPPRKDDADHACRRLISIPMPAAIAESFDSRFGLRHVQGYGMTEITVPVCTELGDTPPEGSSGRPNDPLYDVAVVDPETDDPVATGEVGEIVIRPNLPWAFMLGYDGMPAETADAWRNFWFHTGDAGRFDDRGYLYFVDRIRDRIRRRGENLSSYEIESVILDFDDIIECAVVGVPASEGDDDVMAFVVGPSADGWDPKVLWSHCRERMPYFAIPRYITLVEELPKTSNGKVLKRTLRERGVEGSADLGTIGLSRSRTIEARVQEEAAPRPRRSVDK